MDSHILGLVNGGVWWKEDVVMTEWPGGLQLPGSKVWWTLAARMIVDAKNQMPRAECLAALGFRTKPRHYVL